MNADNRPAIPALLARLGDLHARATFGQWLVEQRESGYPKFDGGPVIKAWDVRTSWGMPVAMGTIAEENPANAALIAELRNTFPSLSSEIQRLGKRDVEMRAMLVGLLRKFAPPPPRNQSMPVRDCLCPDCDSGGIDYCRIETCDHALFIAARAALATQEPRP